MVKRSYNRARQRTVIAWTIVRRLVVQTRICDAALLGKQLIHFTQKLVAKQYTCQKKTTRQARRVPIIVNKFFEPASKRPFVC